MTNSFLSNKKLIVAFALMLMVSLAPVFAQASGFHVVNRSEGVISELVISMRSSGNQWHFPDLNILAGSSYKVLLHSLRTGVEFFSIEAVVDGKSYTLASWLPLNMATEQSIYVYLFTKKQNFWQHAGFSTAIALGFAGHYIRDGINGIRGLISKSPKKWALLKLGPKGALALGGVIICVVIFDLVNAASSGVLFAHPELR